MWKYEVWRDINWIQDWTTNSEQKVDKSIKFTNNITIAQLNEIKDEIKKENKFLAWVSWFISWTLSWILSGYIVYVLTK